MEIPKKIVWLASYPKSGNTWFRAFLTALMNGGEVDINAMKTDGIFSSRLFIEDYTDLDLTYLSSDEINQLQQQTFELLNKETLKSHLFIKVHNAFKVYSEKSKAIPIEPTKCAIYIIRNPLDVVGSFANHFGLNIDETIAFMNTANSMIANSTTNNSNQIFQMLSSWSNHVQSWTVDTPFPVMVIRYEDMLENPFYTFQKAIEFLNIPADNEILDKAIRNSSFNVLKSQELKQGFKEKSFKATQFFRKGSSCNWQNELSPKQIEEVISNHKSTMTQYGYITF